MSEKHPIQENGCRLLSARQWKQLRERVFLRPEDAPEALHKHYSARAPKYRTGNLAFKPTVAEWAEAKRREDNRPRRFA